MSYPSVERLTEIIENRQDSVILIAGETGIGKTYLAQALSINSHSVSKNTCVISCEIFDEWNEIAKQTGGKTIELSPDFSINNIPPVLDGILGDQYVVLNIHRFKRDSSNVAAILDFLEWVRRDFLTNSSKPGNLYIDEIGWFLLSRIMPDVKESFYRLFEGKYFNKRIVLLSQFPKRFPIINIPEYSDILNKVDTFVPLLRSNEEIKISLKDVDWLNMISVVGNEISNWNLYS